VSLSRDPNDEDVHDRAVKQDAIDFIKEIDSAPTPVNYDPMRVPHRLFSLKPDNKDDEKKRRIAIAEMATPHIQKIILQAAAAVRAQMRIKFFQKIATQPIFKPSAGVLFEKFVLSWLASNLGFLECTPAALGSATIKIPGCGNCEPFFFDTKNSLKRVRNIEDDSPPLFLAPTAPNFATIDAIVLTAETIFTVQVTMAERHSAKEAGFQFIETSGIDVNGTMSLSQTMMPRLEPCGIKL
jgi:hypothetical protein